jgi:glycogen debranching enzyme
MSGAPYGYRYIRKTDEAPAAYLVDEAEASVVRRIYEMYTRQQLLNAELLFDRLSLTSFNRDELNLSIELLYEADFVDVFQVRGTQRKVHGRYYRPLKQGSCLCFLYRGLDSILRQTWIEMKPPPTRVDEKSAVSPTPIAPIEVQGYVYDAKYRMSSMLRNLGDTERADKLRREASELARLLDKAYWIADRNYYAMALDGEKQPLACISSNPGHLLFARAVSRERCRAIISRLMHEDMSSGWGWRTLSQNEPTFNPLSYHRGSIWPHENSLIAHGMALYEFRQPAIEILTSLFQAALNFRTRVVLRRAAS